MLNALVEASLRYKLLVLVAVGALVFAGSRAALNVPIDAFPDVTPVQVSVSTESPGLAAEDVEQLLTLPVESALAGLPHVTGIRSVSLLGLSSVSVDFSDDTDIYFARNLVAERLTEVSDRIPEGFGKPVLGQNSSGLGQVFWFTLERADEKLRGGLSDMELRTLQDWNVRINLRTAPGVDDVLSWGGQEKQYEVVLDPLKLIRYGLGFREVVERIGLNNAEVGGQYVNFGPEQYTVRGLGLLHGQKDLGEIVVKAENGVPVLLRDVATISEAAALRYGAVTRDGKEVVLGMTLARIGENAKAVVDGVKLRVKSIQDTLPKGAVIRPIYDRTDLAKQAVGTAVRALIEGSVLVAIVLYLFLGEFRSALVVIAALPLTMLIVFLLMQAAGFSANLMSLAGLAIGIGMMVDGAVVMVENAFRIMSERFDRGEKVNRTAAVLAAAREVANPIAFAILIIVVVFLPLFSLQGLEGKLFKPMAYSISFAMAGSLLLTLTVIPVLAAMGLKPKPEHDTRLLAWIKRNYASLLHWGLAHRRIVLGGAVTALLASLVIFPFLGKEFMPTLQEGSLIWRVSLVPSTSLEESVRVSQRISATLKQFPEVDTVLALIGRAEKGESEDVNNMEVFVSLKPRDEWTTGNSIEEITGPMREKLEAAIPEAGIALSQPIQSRVEELISGVRATLALKVYGDDLDTLGRLSTQVRQVLGKIRGAKDLALEANAGKPQVRIQVKRDELARLGLNADDVLNVVRQGIGNDPVSTLIDGVRRFDITVRLPDTSKASVEAMGAIPLRSPSGALVPLRQVASISIAEGYSFVRREQLSRYAVLQMDVQGRDVNGFVKEADAAIKAQVKLPPGYRLEWGGAFENQQRALGRLALIVPITIGLIFVLLYTAFNSLRFAGMVLANVPFAIIGGVLGLAITGQYLSVPSAIGFIAVFGVAMLNGIVLISFMNQLRDQGRTVRQAVVDGTDLRLRPVLMTASVAILGLLPMLLSGDVGAEVQRPLATVVVGGLLTSTLLTLLLLPVVYDWIEQRREEAKH
jgi:cobalt-zinc-cadmium resistance protein CzcA